MSLFGGGGARSSQATTAPEVASAVRIQRSVNGAAVPVVYGTQRLPGNLIWYGDFIAQRRQQWGGKSGGKGGATGGGGKGQSQPGSNVYFASFALGLAAGTIQGIGRVWDTTGAPDTPPALGGNVSIMTGASGQAPWSYLAAKHPDQALGYNGLAYVGVARLSLGDAGALPNLTFEVMGLGPAAACTAWSVPPSGHAWEPVFTAPSYSAAPFAAIASVLGAPSGPNIVFDTSPAFCIVDLLTNSTYGAGLDVSLIGDPTGYATWCQANGLAFSAALTEQRDVRSILRDWLDATLADAFWSDGQIKLATYADQPVTGTVADDKTVVAFAPVLTPVMNIDDSLMMVAADDAGPLAVTRKDPAEVYNRYTVEYADRDKDYNTSTVTADDA